MEYEECAAVIQVGGSWQRSEPDNAIPTTIRPIPVLYTSDHSYRYSSIYISYKTPSRQYHLTQSASPSAYLIKSRNILRNESGGSFQTASQPTT